MNQAIEEIDWTLPRASEIESIFDRKMHEVVARLQYLKKLTEQTRSSQSREAWDTLIKNYAVLLEVNSRLNTVINALEWDLNGKHEWELQHNKKFDPELNCGDG